METSSSLSLATVLALSVAGTQMSTLLGHTGWGDVRIAESRDGRLAGALLHIHNSASRRRVWGISRPSRRRGENLLGALETRAREGVTLIPAFHSLGEKEAENGFWP